MLATVSGTLNAGGTFYDDARLGRWRYFDGTRWGVDAVGRATNCAKLIARDML